MVQEIKRKTRCKFPFEEKIRTALEGLKGEESRDTICRREGINPTFIIIGAYGRANKYWVLFSDFIFK